MVAILRQDALGYGEPGRALYVGVRVSR